MRSRKWKLAVACLMVVPLLATLGPACGEEGEKDKVVITIGNLTGPASYACRYVTLAMDDMTRYYNEEGLIPGVEIELLTYNNMADPARDIPGYDWLRERGTEVIIAILHTTSETLKPFAERDKVALIATWATVPIA